MGARHTHAAARARMRAARWLRARSTLTLSLNAAAISALACRILKDLSVTNAEIEKQSAKIATMKAEQADVYDVKKQVRSAQRAALLRRCDRVLTRDRAHRPCARVERRRRCSRSASRRARWMRTGWPRRSKISCDAWMTSGKAPNSTISKCVARARVQPSLCACPLTFPRARVGGPFDPWPL